MTTEARFLCAVCGAIAGQVRLLRGGEPRPDRSRARADALADADALIRPADQAALVVDTFYGVASQPVSGERFGCVADAVAAADTAGLYALGYSYAPFHCPDCGRHRCGGEPARGHRASRRPVRCGAGRRPRESGRVGSRSDRRPGEQRRGRRQAIPRMLGRGGGHIVNISSMAGCVVIPGTVASSASKAALSHLTAGLRADLRGLPIRTTLVELGPIPTDMLAATEEYEPTARSFRRFYRMHLIVDVPREKVADEVVRAVQQGRRHVRIPKRAALFPMLSEVPRRTAELLLGGVPAGSYRRAASSSVRQRASNACLTAAARAATAACSRTYSARPEGVSMQIGW